MSGNLKLAACHKFYLYNAVSLLYLVSYFHTDFGNDVFIAACPLLHRKMTPTNRAVFEIIMIHICVFPVSSLGLGGFLNILSCKLFL